jgi:hypothetical protein
VATIEEDRDGAGREDYEAPQAEQVDSTEGPAVTSAGGTIT